MPLISSSSWITRMVFNVSILLLVTFTVLYLGGIVFAYTQAHGMIFPKVEASYQDSAGIIKLDTSDGERISAYHLKSESSPKLLLYSHGNGEDIGHARPLLEAIHERGYSVFAYDYPGYGTSTGTPSESGVFAAAEAAYRYATETLGYKPADITLYGRSLGSGPSCWLAEQYPVGGLILDGAFSSTFRVMTHVRILPWDYFNNIARLPKIDCPMLVLHGKQDRTVPFSHAVKNAQVAKGSVKTLWHDTAGHNDLIEQLGTKYWDTVLPFIGQTL
ncbi:MAG: alpha/beta hydrolase [Opitutaceae bacterium]